MSDIAEKKRMASGRRMSIAEGFVQTIGINMGGVFVPNFVLTAFLLEIMHASNTLIGFATSIQFFIGLLQPLANLLVHRVKMRRILVMVTGVTSRLLFIGAIFWGMYNSGPGAESVFMVLLLAGAFAMAFSSSGWSTWMADIVPENIRGRYFALRNSVCSIAGILGILAAGWLLKSLPGSGGFVVIYLIAAGAAIIGSIIILFQYEVPSVEIQTGSLWSNYKEIFKDRNFMSFVKTVIFFNLALIIAAPFFTVHFLTALKVPYETMALFTALAAITAILGNIFFGKLSDVLGNRFIIRMSLMMMIIPTVLMLLIPATNTLPFVAAVILLQSFFMAGWALAIFNTSLSISPRGKRSLYIGVFSALNAVSAVIAPLIGGLLIDFYKGHPFPIMGHTFPPTFVVFALSAVLLLLGLLAFPTYREGNRYEDYSLRDVVLRFDFPEIIYKLFMSTFIPRISSRNKFAEDIADMRSPAALVPLGKLLRDMEPSVRLSALEGLGRTGAAEALEVLLEFFPRAGVLEKVELMKSLGSFTEDPRVLSILIEETASPFPTLRIRALHSLKMAAANPAVHALVLARIQRELENRETLSFAGLVEEEYLAYLDILLRAGDLRGLTLSRSYYESMKDPVWQKRYLHAYSRALGVHDQFYHFLSVDIPDDEEAVLDESRAAAVAIILRNRGLRDAHSFLKRMAEEYKGNIQAFLESAEKALMQALSPAPPEVREFIEWLLHKPDRSMAEEVLLLQVIRHHL